MDQLCYQIRSTGTAASFQNHSYAEAAEKLQEMYGNTDILAMDIAWMSDDSVMEMRDLATSIVDDEPYIMGDNIKKALEEIANVAEAFEEE